MSPISEVPYLLEALGSGDLSLDSDSATTLRRTLVQVTECESQCPHYKSIRAPIQPTHPAEKYGSVRLYVSYALKVTKCI